MVALRCWGRGGARVALTRPPSCSPSQTTLLPMIQMNPLPFPYYRNMVLLLIVFELVVALKISLQGFVSLGLQEKLTEMTIDFLLFASISYARARLCSQPRRPAHTRTHTPRICTAPGCLHSRVHTAPRLMPSRLMPARPTPSRLMPSLYVGVGRLLCQSLWITSISLLMPWRPDGQRAGSTINLPAEYFIMLPLAGHRRLFEAYGPEGDAPEAERSSSIFLRPFHRDDADHLAKFRTTDSWKMMQILHASFRELAPGDGTAAAAAAHATTVEIGPVEDPSQRAVYRLMRNSGERCTSPHMLDD